MEIPDGYILISKIEYEQMCKQIELLMARVKELEGMLHKDSHNSHKPPGSNEFKKIKNNRMKGEHSQGGQPGNEGTTSKYPCGRDHRGFYVLL
mgnify:CR=1 FL=1